MNNHQKSLSKKLGQAHRLLPPHICRHLPPSAEGFYHTDALLLG